MTIIAFNFLPYTSQGHGGAEVYLENIALSLANYYPETTVYFFINKQQKGKYTAIAPNIYEIACESFLGTSRISRIFLEQLLLPLKCKRFKIDWLISNYVSPLLGNTKKVVIVHDMLYKRYPLLFEKTKLFYWKILLPLSMYRSHIIGTVSNFSASEIATFNPNTQKKIFITAEGIRPSLMNATTHNKTLSSIVRSKYIICVATFGAHKNLITLVKAFSLIRDDFPTLKLYFTGGAKTPDAKSYQLKVKAAVTDHKLEQNVLFLGHIDDSEFASLYSHAEATVMPSFYEGFGLPIIESHFFGTPVICSNCASMPEVVGEAGLLFDPKNPTDIAKQLKNLLTSPQLQNHLSKKCKSNIEKYTWLKAAKQLMNTLNSHE